MWGINLDSFFKVPLLYCIVKISSLKVWSALTFIQNIENNM